MVRKNTVPGDGIHEWGKSEQEGWYTAW